MPPEFPPRPSTRTTVALAAVALVTFLYSIVVAGQILVWFVLVGVAVGVALVYLLVIAVFRLVAAVERIATAAEVDSGIRTAAEARPSADAADGDAPGESVSEDPAPEAPNGDHDDRDPDPDEHRRDTGGTPGDSVTGPDGPGTRSDGN